MRIILYLMVFMGMAPAAFAQMGLHYNEVQQRYPEEATIPEPLENVLADYKRTGPDEMRMILYNEDSVVISISIYIKTNDAALTKTEFEHLLAQEVPSFQPTQSLYEKNYLFELDSLHDLLVMRGTADETAPFPTRHIIISGKPWMKRWMDNTKAASWLKD